MAEAAASEDSDDISEEDEQEEGEQGGEAEEEGLVRARAGSAVPRDRRNRRVPAPSRGAALRYCAQGKKKRSPRPRKIEEEHCMLECYAHGKAPRPLPRAC